MPNINQFWSPCGVQGQLVALVGTLGDSVLDDDTLFRSGTFVICIHFIDVAGNY